MFIHFLHSKLLNYQRVQFDASLRSPIQLAGKKSQGWWRVEINGMADLMEAMVSLKIEDAWKP